MTEVTPAAPETGAAQPSLRDTLLETVKASEAGTLETPPAPPPVDTGEGETPTADGRPRDDKGRFAAKDATAESPAAPAAETQPPAADGTDATTTTPAAPAAAAPAPAAEPPQHWPQADKDMFAKAPPEFQQWALRRDREVNEGFQRKVQSVAPLLNAVVQAKPYLDTIGVTPEAAFANLVASEYVLRNGTPEQKAAMAQKMLRDYQITLPGSTSQPTETPAGEQPADQSAWEDPTISALRRDVQAANMQTAQLRHLLLSQHHSRAIQEIAAFEAEKTADGKPAHPHLNDLYPDIIRLAQAEVVAGRQPVLKQLYETAMWANPAVRAQLLEQQQREQQRKQQEEAKAKEAEAKAKAAQAKAAAASVNGAPRGGAPGAQTSGSLRQILEQNAAQGARV